VRNFAEHTSMHGIGRVILTKKPEKRVAWAIVFVSAWALFALQLTSVLTKYFEYSKKTTAQLVAGGAPFPAITLCNLQSLDFYVILKFLKDREESKSNSNIVLNQPVGINRPLPRHGELLLDAFRKFWDRNEKTEWDKSDLDAVLSRTSLKSNLPKDVLDEIAVKQQEFIVKCNYGNSNCNLTEITDSHFLKCFTFEPPNIRNTSFENFQSLSEGIASGLSVTVFTGIQDVEHNYTNIFVPGVYEKGSPLSGSSGVRVVIHPPGTEPFPLTEGQDVPPGYQASIGIVPERRIRLGKPYGLCARRNRYQHNYVDKLRGSDTEEREPYRKVSCERMCMQQKVIKECNCFDDTLPDMGNVECNDAVCWLVNKNDTQCNDIQKQKVVACRRIASIEECAMNDSCNATLIADTLKNIRCADNVTNRLMTDLEALSKCKCYAPCDEFRYYTLYSLAKWPSSGYERDYVLSDIFTEERFMSRFPEDKREFYETSINRTEFAKVNVYITDSNVLEIIEEPAIILTQLISDVGGQLGLWIGVSVITVSEVIETILTIATSGFRKLYRKLKVRVENPEEEIQTGSSLV